MEREQADMMEPSSSTTKADPPKEVKGSTSEVNSSHEGDKEDRMTSEEDKIHRKSDTLEGYTKVCSYLVGIKKSEETDSSNTKPDPPKEVEDSTSEVDPSHDGDKEDRMTSEEDKTHRKSETLESYTKVCSYHVKKKSEESDTIMVLDEVQSETATVTEKQDAIDTQKPGKTNLRDDSTLSHANLTMPGSQNKHTGESESLTMTKAQRISAKSVQYSTDYTEISEREISEPPQKRSRIDADLVVDISERDTPDNTDVIEVIQIDPLVDATKTDNQLQSNTVQESTDLEIIENKDTGMKQTKADFNVAQSKAVSNVILIDEQNTDSQGSAATDDSVIFVDDGMKENTSDTQQPR